MVSLQVWELTWCYKCNDQCPYKWKGLNMKMQGLEEGRRPWCGQTDCRRAAINQQNQGQKFPEARKCQNRNFPMRPQESIVMLASCFEIYNPTKTKEYIYIIFIILVCDMLLHQILETNTYKLYINCDKVKFDFLLQ